MRVSVAQGVNTVLVLENCARSEYHCGMATTPGAELMKSKMAELDLSQQELARRSQVPQSHISNILKDEGHKNWRPITPHEARSMAPHLQVGPRDLLAGQPVEKVVAALDKKTKSLILDLILRVAD